ncbi:short chain dehydrogenase [Cordyceps fumosorosea ARSEF 2679]|uniref:Short chain dehydrogenase n=1 Tax=Cordyceps fumosorosea (strain ARSEF 2679) TaxID=1081104 RepID=A0A162JIE1_CORFA|nr:short chain dehydrogenase [Cordyceps fumosorosea ARSEF 2679]OAA69452.1 short chain dehydrogenase [Cordyceps fumosorosea ARSEF 2679]
MAASPPFYAVVVGVGSGTGASVARLFARRGYPVALLARKDANLTPVVDAVTAAGGTALGIPTDVSDPASLDAAFAAVAATWPGARLAAAVYNAEAGFAYKPFLELTPEDLDRALATGAKGLFHFAQRTIPQLLDAVPSEEGKEQQHPPTLIVTGATAALRGSARFATFAAGKFAQRALAQSLAREFGPRGVHVAYAIIDGVIDTPWGKDRVANDGKADGKISPDAIAESYWHLHTQPRSAFTHELDLRPFVEKF